MAETKITKRTVDAALPREDRYIIFDSQIPGFGLRVYPTGQKSWIFEYRAGEGGRRANKKRITIGRSTDFTPDQARKVADQLRSSVKLGADPQDAKKAQRAAVTVKELAATFRSDHLEARRAKGTQDNYGDLIERIILPELGHRKAKDVRHADVAAMHLKWQHTPYQANRALAVLSSMYGFGNVDGGSLPLGYNPVADVERFPELERTAYLKADQLLALGDALILAETDGIPFTVKPGPNSKHLPKTRSSTVVDPHAVAAIRLLLFTGARLREILTLEWDEVDFENGMLMLRKHKNFRLKGPKIIALNDAALAILENVPKVGKYVIASASAGTPNERPRADLKRPWALIRRHAGLETVRLHDLRHNFGSQGAGKQLGLPVIGKLLGHSRPTTTSRYAFVQIDPARRASNMIGKKIAKAMNPKGGKS